MVFSFDNDYNLISYDVMISCLTKLHPMNPLNGCGNDNNMILIRLTKLRLWHPYVHNLMSVRLVRYMLVILKLSFNDCSNNHCKAVVVVVVVAAAAAAAAPVD